MDPRTARKRRRGRELAAQMLSSWDANPGPPPSTISAVGDLTRASAAHLAFAERLARAVWERIEEIDRCLAETIRPQWRESMGRVERSVLRVAVAELLIETAPPRVVLTEAIEVARRYAGEAAAPFVHAVLDGVMKSRGLVVVEPGEPSSSEPSSPEPSSSEPSPPAPDSPISGSPPREEGA